MDGRKTPLVLAAAALVIAPALERGHDKDRMRYHFPISQT